MSDTCRWKCVWVRPRSAVHWFSIAWAGCEWDQRENITYYCCTLSHFEDCEAEGTLPSQHYASFITLLDRHCSYHVTVTALTGVLILLGLLTVAGRRVKYRWFCCLFSVCFLVDLLLVVLWRGVFAGRGAWGFLWNYLPFGWFCQQQPDIRAQQVVASVTA